MLYNNDLTRKLKYGAIALALCFSGYSFLTYMDQTIQSTRLYIIVGGILLSVISAILMKRPSIALVVMYSIGLIAIASSLLFRIRVNMPMDILLFGIGIGIAAGFGSQLKKKNEFA